MYQKPLREAAALVRRVTARETTFLALKVGDRGTTGPFPHPRKESGKKGQPTAEAATRTGRGRSLNLTTHAPGAPAALPVSLTLACSKKPPARYLVQSDTVLHGCLVGRSEALGVRQVPPRPQPGYKTTPVRIDTPEHLASLYGADDKSVHTRAHGQRQRRRREIR